MPFVEATGTASALTSTTTWDVVSATDIDTCEFVSVPVDAITMLFTAPATGSYDIHAALLTVSPLPPKATWSLMARVGTLCCGGVIFCEKLSAAAPIWRYSSFFLKQNDTLSLVWSSSAARSVANISVHISLDRNPTVYVDDAGSDSHDGSFDSPVLTLERGLSALAALVTSKTTAATIVLGPTLHAVKATSPSSASGFNIPDILRTVSLTIQSQVSRKATSIYEAWAEQSYCNYNTHQCTTQAAFEDSVYGTSFDTEIQGCVIFYEL
jgi:hypothetical protein